jgi:hypothetical protein
MKINDEVEFDHRGHRISPVAWHHVKTDTTIPIRVCYDCGCQLTNREMMLLDLMEITSGGIEARETVAKFQKEMEDQQIVDSELLSLEITI